MIRFLLILLFSGFVSTSTFAQLNASPGQKIGLVLSGGGAKGMAHIGVLKAMEKAGIRPDYIAGTSMGSIVGGLYALGYSADQLEVIVSAIDWDQLLSNNIPLTYISYEEKEYYNRYLLELYIQEGKLSLPSGLIQGQTLSESLSHYTWPAKNYKSFADFPIPFRCIATDVSTGKEIIFKDGPLAEAMRASMAIPTAFTAADLDSTLAVDGGILNNFPVEEVKKMGADIVIGINVSGGFEDAKDLGSMVGILLQISMFPSLERLEEQQNICGIYIEPDLKGNSTASFGNYKEILELGNIAGEKHQAEFLDLAKKLKLKAQTFDGINMEATPVVLDEIKLVGLKSTNERLVLSKLRCKVGDSVSRKELEQGIRRVYGINNFKKVTYHLQKTTENKVVLTIKLSEKPEQIFKAGLHYDDVFSVGVTANYTRRNLLGKGTRAIFAVDVSENPRFHFDFLKYAGSKRKYALNLRYDYRHLRIPTYEGGEVLDFEINRNHIASIGLRSTQSLEEYYFLNLNYEFEGFKYTVGNITPDGVKSIRFNWIYSRGGYVRNTHNDRNYPSSGMNLELLVNLYPYNDYSLKYNDGVDSILVAANGSEPEILYSKNEFNQILNDNTPDFFTTAYLHYSRIAPVRKNFQIIPELSLGLTFAKEKQGVIFHDFLIGGSRKVNVDDISFMGLHYRELSTSNIATAGLYFQHILFKNLFLRYGVNGLVYHDYLPIDQLDKFDFEDTFSKNSILGYGLNLKYKSFIGPISFGISFNNLDSRPRYYFSIGLSLDHAD